MSIFTSMNCKIYNLTPKTQILPAFLEKSERKKLLEDDSYHLIQEGYFPHICSSLRISPDQQSILATGQYPHQVRLFDLENSTVKFQRNQHAETVDATFLGSDWRKFALVLDDKSVEVHNHQGKVFSSKLPKPARTMCFDTHEATLCVGGTSSNIYRLDLYKGLFRSNFQLTCEHVNQLKYYKELELLMACCDNQLAVIDHRVEKQTNQIECKNVTSVAFDKQKLILGTAGSEILVYDIRSSQPLHRLSQFTHPIKQLEFAECNGEKLLLAADLRQMKCFTPAWEQKFTIEPGYGINNFGLFAGSGLIAMACEHQFINLFYVPELGPAPKFAKDLDQQVLNLDIQQQSGEFANYKFCTRQELEAMGLAALVESGQVVTYMHGFYVPKDLYRKQIQKEIGKDLKTKREEAKQKQVQEKQDVNARKARKDDRFDEE